MIEETDCIPNKEPQTSDNVWKITKRTSETIGDQVITDLLIIRRYRERQTAVARQLCACGGIL